jgi:alpha-ketoglutarate-dependent 2,4-dichlorophenoxyacetate dioxygenase
MTLRIKPILAKFGAEISGVDLTAPLTEAEKQEIIAAQDRWGITVWRNTGLDDDSHIAFSRIFGHVELAPVSRLSKPRFTRRELFDAGNLDAEGNIVDNEMRRAVNKGNQLWHTDSSFMEVRSAQSLLLAHEVPPAGGKTWFADTRSAYDDLPQAMKDRIEDLEADHSYWWSRSLAGYPLSEEEMDQRPSARHRLVHVHKGSGRKALFIGAHARDIVGMDREEGRKLIKELVAHATQPKYVFSVDWNVGDLTIWDNLCSMHRGGEFDETKHRRDMRRTTIREGAAPLTPDDPFDDMFRKSFTTLTPAEQVGR